MNNLASWMAPGTSQPADGPAITAAKTSPTNQDLIASSCTSTRESRLRLAPEVPPAAVGTRAEQGGHRASSRFCSSLDTSRMRWTGGTVALRRTGFRLMSTKDGPTTAVVHSRGEAPDSRGLVSLRCRPVTVGRTFGFMPYCCCRALIYGRTVSSQDAGISGTIFHSWQGGSWMQLAPGAAELDIEGHSFVLADDDATIQVGAAGTTYISCWQRFRQK